MLNTDFYSKEINVIKSFLLQHFPYKTSEFGKMIRSKIGILLLKSCNIMPDNDYLRFLSAIELLHNASLLHDDVIDDDFSRRGIKNIKSIYNNKTSILYGNMLSANAIKVLPEKKYNKTVNILLQTITNMCEGELFQQSQLNIIPSLDDYIEKTRLKTSSLFIALAKGLAELSDNETLFKLIGFCQNYGIAFQIKNDIDNVLTDNSDRENGIYTAPYIFSSDYQVTKSSLEKTVSLKDNYVKEAISNLVCLKESIYKTGLIGEVECLIN